MFERFTEPARQSVVLAQDEARFLRQGYLGTEHLLLGLLGIDAGVASRALDLLGIRVDDVRSDIRRVVGPGPGGGLADEDADALRSLGIDLDEVRRRVEETFGPGALDRTSPRGRRGRCEWVAGAIPFAPRAKKVLELALREARALGHGYIGPEHILLGLAREGHGLAAEILRQRGATLQRVGAVVLSELGRDLPGRSA